MTDPTPFIPDGWSTNDPGFGTYRWADLPSGWEYVGTEGIVWTTDDHEGYSAPGIVVVARKRPEPKVTVELSRADVETFIDDWPDGTGYESMKPVLAACQAALAEQEAGTT